MTKDYDIEAFEKLNQNEKSFRKHKQFRTRIIGNFIILIIFSTIGISSILKEVFNVSEFFSIVIASIGTSLLFINFLIKIGDMALTEDINRRLKDKND